MNRYCDGIRRRQWLKAGAFGGFGLGLADLLRMEAHGELAGESRGKSAICIYLDGGQSHLDSWDLKPDAGETAGEFQPIATNLPGLDVCEHMPRLARQADKYAVLRGTRVHRSHERKIALPVLVPPRSDPLLDGRGDPSDMGTRAPTARERGSRKRLCSDTGLRARTSRRTLPLHRP